MLREPATRSLVSNHCYGCVWISILLSIAAGSLSVVRAQESSWQPPRDLATLPKSTELPPLLVQRDGSAITTHSQWAERRADLQAMIQYYEYGHLPPTPETITARTLSKRELVTEAGETMGEEVQLELTLHTEPPQQVTIAIALPSAARQAPTILTEVHRITPLPIIPQLVQAGYVVVQYQREDLAADRSDAIGPARTAFPEQDWGTLAIWAWGAMAVMDYLETRDEIDASRVAITGHSRGGKVALLAGALDKRFALVAPNGSGCGGAGCFRQTPRTAESLAQITDPQRFGYWFHPRLRVFADREDQLPIDQHMLKALVAPRALLCTEAAEDLWANPEGSRRTSLAAQAVFDWLEASDKNGWHLRAGGHDQTVEDWDALRRFADWHLRGIRPPDASEFRVPQASLELSSRQ